jgi:hypothetical protein
LEVRHVSWESPLALVMLIGSIGFLVLCAKVSLQWLGLAAVVASAGFLVLCVGATIHLLSLSRSFPPEARSLPTDRRKGSPT